MDAGQFSAAKLELRNRLDGLREELDRHLAKEYGVESTNRKTYEQWRDSHQPFHWFAEFYGIMRKGGFDVIIGNPPYVEYGKVKGTYTIKGYETESCGNLYAFVMERNTNLTGKVGRSGMIVPHSAVCTDRMAQPQQLLLNNNTAWVSTYDIRPSKLFEGVDQRLCIYVALAGRTPKAMFSSRYHRWHQTCRPLLLQSTMYVNTKSVLLPNSVPKIQSLMEVRLLEKLQSNTPLSEPLRKSVGEIIYYHNAPRYWVRATDFTPYFWNERDGEQLSSQVKTLILETKIDAKATVAALNSSLFYCWYLILSDCRHLNLREIESFPIGLDRMPKDVKMQLANLTKRLMTNFKQNKHRKVTEYKATGRVIYDEFDQKPSKPIVDEIDRSLANHYGFTDEELDFIINYDIKYRMGRETLKSGL